MHQFFGNIIIGAGCPDMGDAGFSAASRAGSALERGFMAPITARGVANEQ
jgi:hypothetical protein